MMQTGADKVWIIDDDKSIRWVLDKALKKAAIDSHCSSGA